VNKLINSDYFSTYALPQKRCFFIDNKRFSMLRTFGKFFNRKFAVENDFPSVFTAKQIRSNHYSRQ